MKSYAGVTIQMKPLQQFFHMGLLSIFQNEFWELL